MYNVSDSDKNILRNLAAVIKDISADPINTEREILWRKNNDLQESRPMISIFQIPWNEMNVDDELTLRCTGRFAQSMETQLRRQIYQWNHMPGDIIITDEIACSYVIEDTGFGISEDVDVAKTDESSNVVSRHFNKQISSEDDIYKIKMPVITHHKEKTEEKYESMQNVFEGILKVNKKGVSGFWFAPWDDLVRWYVPQDAMLDMYINPDLLHKSMSRLVDAHLCRLDQLEQQNLLSLNNNGSNATYDLPGDDYNPDYVKPHNMWATGAAQIFSEISPAMHLEFALEHEVRFFKRFGLNYYGCCEPLHKKIDILQIIPNLRKISMSPWIDVNEGAEALGKKYVFMRKPNPAIFASDSWHPELARRELTDCLDITKRYGCIVQLHMKDISTVRYHPERLWEWSELAAEISQQYSV